MDLSTTKKIKRRILEISPNQNKDLTDCSITVSNWFQSIDTSNMKFRISSFYMNNSTICDFIPKYLSSIYPLGFPGGVGVNNYLIQDPSGGSPLIGTPVLTNTITDYYVSVRRIADGNVTTSYIYMEDVISEYPELKPAIHPGSSFEQYSNRYYWFFNTSKFCDIISLIINEIFVVGFGQPSDMCSIIRTSQGYGLYLSTVVSTLYEVQMSPSLNDLFQFKSVESTNSPELRTIIFNTNLRSYGNPTAPHAFVASNYVPDTWFPFNEMLIKSNLPIESEIFFDNSNFKSQDYQNIMLTFDLSNNNPDGIYNFYRMKAESGDNWVSMVGTNTKENCTFETLLRLRETKDLIPYTINKKEQFRLVTETIETDAIVQDE